MIINSENQDEFFHVSSYRTFPFSLLEFTDTHGLSPTQHTPKFSTVPNSALSPIEHTSISLKQRSFERVYGFVNAAAFKRALRTDDRHLLIRMFDI
jgi:hypothetical protein